jgi:hypothetical protein
MAEDLGSVFSEVRLRLDSLDYDIMTVSKKFDGLGKKILSGAERPSEALKKTVKALTDEIGGLTQKFTALTGGDAAKYFKDLEKAIKEAEKAGDAETWAMLEGQREQAKEIEKTIRMLERKKATAETDVVKAQEGEEEARLATILSLQNNYEAELREINDLYNLGVVSAKERDTQIQQAQMEEIKGLEQLKNEYGGLEKEQEAIGDRLKKQAEQHNKLGKAIKNNNSIFSSFTALATAALDKIIDLGSRAVGAAIQFANESIAAYQAQEVANARLGAVVMATGADAWTSQRQLMDMADELGKRTGYAAGEIQNMQSVLLGFTSITGDTFNRASEGLINMAAVMGGDLASAANQFGKALDNPVESLTTLTRYGFKFTDQQKEEIKVLEEAGKHAEAQTKILESMEAAFGSAAVDINKAVFSQNNYNRVIADFKRESGEQFENAVTPIRNFFASIIEKAAESIGKINAARKAIALLRADANGEEVFTDDVEGNLERVIAQIERAEGEIERIRRRAARGSFLSREDTDSLREYQEELSGLISKRKELEAELEQENAVAAAVAAKLPAATQKAFEMTEEVKNRQDALNQSLKAYNDELAAIDRKEAEGIITSKEAEEQRASAAEKQAADIIALQQQYKEFLDIEKEIGIVQQMIDDAGGDPEGKLGKELENLKNQKEAYETYLRLIDSEIIKQAELVRQDQQRAADRSLEEQTEEYTRQIQDLTASEYEAYEIERQRALIALQATADYQRASDDKKRELENELNLYYAAQKRLAITGELESSADGYRDAARDITREMENRRRLGESEIEWQERVIENEKQWAIEEFKKSEAYQNALAELAEGNEEYLSLVNDVIAAIGERAEAAKAAIEETSNISFGQEMLSWAKDNVVEIANAGAQVLNSLVDISTTLIQREIEEQNRLLKEQHDEKMKMLDEEMQARLYALGLVEAETVADYKAQLEAAKLTGDELAIYEASQAHTKAQIEQEYADEKARIDEELARKQAELQYQSEMASWKAQMAQAFIGAAQSQIAIWADMTLTTWAKPAMAALAAATTAAQIAVIAVNKPVPRFETGGIVPGSSYSGDHMMIRANSGEAVLTHEQQRNMMDMLNNPARNGPIANVTIVFQMDAAEIGRKTFQLAGDGYYFLKARAVH